MTTYILFNRETGQTLSHPQTGVPYVVGNNIKDLKASMEDFHEYLKLKGWYDFKDNFIIVDSETGEEVML